MYNNKNEKKWTIKKALKILSWLVAILLTIQLFSFTIDKVINKRSGQKERVLMSQVLNPKYYVIQSNIDASNADEATVLSIYDMAMHDMKLVNEGKVDTSHVETYMKVPFILMVSNEIAETISNTNLLRKLKQVDHVRYNNSAKEFCKITPKYEAPKVDGDKVAEKLNKMAETLNDLNYALGCLKFRTVKYSIDYGNAVDSDCNNAEADELIKQFNLIVSGLNKAQKENLPIGLLVAAIDGYKQYIASTCKHRVNELKLLPN